LKLADCSVDHEASGWYGCGAPRRTPAAVIAKLDKEIEAVLADEKMKARLIGAGVEPMFMAAGEFAKLIVDEAEKWGNS
jgi:tripartite-type tricarboxylate transporter receptor subunit TctC